MAVQFRKDKQKWRCYWRNPYTKKIESKSFDSEREARKYDSLVKHRLKYEQESFYKEPEPQINIESLTLEQAHFLYLQAKSFSDKGLAWQADCMRRIHALIGKLPIADIDRETLDAVKRKELSDPDIKPVSVRAHMSVLRTVLRWCVSEGYLDSMPVFPTLPPAHYEHFIPPTVAEVEAIYAAAPEHLRRVILLACSTGARVGQCELFGIRWSDIDLDRHVLSLRAARKRPDEPVREIPLRDSLMPVLVEWCAADQKEGIDHVIHFNGKPVSSIKRSWATALRNAGITRPIRPYDLRHFFGSEAIAAGVDIGTVAKLMGHSSPIMLLKHYQHVADLQKKKAVEALPALDLSKGIQAGHTF